MYLNAGQIERAPRAAQLRLAMALGLRHPDPTPHEIALVANAHQQPVMAADLERERQVAALMRLRGWSRTRALWELRRSEKK